MADPAAELAAARVAHRPRVVHSSAPANRRSP
jgi:hypothetical protein